MAKLKSVGEVEAAADELAKKFAELPHVFHPVGEPMSTPDTRFPGYQHMMRNHMAFVLALSPEQLSESVQHLTDASSHTGYEQSDTVTADINQINRHLANWHGTAKDALQRQVDFIKDFTIAESSALLKLAQAVAGLYTLAKNTRAGYCDFVEQTIASIDAAQKADEERADKFVASLIGGVVRMCLDIVNPVALVADAADVAGKGIEYSVEGSSIDKALQSYGTNMTKMHENFHGELEDAVKVITGGREDFNENEFRLFEPLDPHTSISGPDFDYDDFRTAARSDTEFGPKVEAERKKEASRANPSQPAGVIQQRLAGPR
jgi:hypothetical protein